MLFPSKRPAWQISRVPSNARPSFNWAILFTISGSGLFQAPETARESHTHIIITSSDFVCRPPAYAFGFPKHTFWLTHSAPAHFFVLSTCFYWDHEINRSSFWVPSRRYCGWVLQTCFWLHEPYTIRILSLSTAAVGGDGKAYRPLIIAPFYSADLLLMICVEYPRYSCTHSARSF